MGEYIHPPGRTHRYLLLALAALLALLASCGGKEVRSRVDQWEPIPGGVYVEATVTNDLAEAVSVDCFFTGYDDQGDILIVDDFTTPKLDPGQSGRIAEVFFEKAEYDLPYASVGVQCFA